MTFREAVETVEKLVGCGDGSCLYVTPVGASPSHTEQTSRGCSCADKWHPAARVALANLFKAAKREVEGR
jgi:hypothetical protein